MNRLWAGLILLLVFSLNTFVVSAEPKLVIKQKLLPYKKWTKEYQNYFQRHYRDPSLTLKPKAIVMHYTGALSFSSAWSTFYNGDRYDDGDVGVVFGHLSVHYMIDRRGVIYQLLPDNVRCRGAYGVNHVALSVEITARNEADILRNKKQLMSSILLVKYLMKKHCILPNKVYGHYQVAKGRKVVSEYLDYGDRKYPNYYSPRYGRSDPGRRYMKILWKAIKRE